MNDVEFSDQQFETLADWRRSKGITDIVELEGFLTAIVIGPRTLSPVAWLPRIWGGKRTDFKDLAEMNRFVALVMGFYNSIVLIFETSPEEFEPTFYQRNIRGRTVFIVDEWCWGFMKGMRLDAAAWNSLKRERPELLKPLHLFGTKAGFRELDAGGADKMHALWSPRIAPAVRDIHLYWLPYRRLVTAGRGGTQH